MTFKIFLYTFEAITLTNKFFSKKKYKDIDMETPIILFRNKVDRIKNYKTYTAKQKEDKLLEIDCNQYTNLGKDSTKTEKQTVRNNSYYIYKAIKEFNKQSGELYLRTFEK